MSDRSTAHWKPRLQLAGIVLWRGGMAFVLAWGFYHGAWQMIRQLPWPKTVLLGSAIALAGFGLVMLSLILERVAAARREGDSLRD